MLINLLVVQCSISFMNYEWTWNKGFGHTAQHETKHKSCSSGSLSLEVDFVSVGLFVAIFLFLKHSLKGSISLIGWPF